MNILKLFRSRLAEKSYLAKEALVKSHFVNIILEELNIHHPVTRRYRETIFNFHTRRHFLSLDLMDIIKAVHLENNPQLLKEVQFIVGEFSYIPNANSYCPPMIRLNIQSSSILRPSDEFASDAVDIEINNQRLERKINRCQSVINKYNSHLLSGLVLNNPV